MPISIPITYILIYDFIDGLRRKYEVPKANVQEYTAT